MKLVLANEIMPNIKTVFSIHISGLSKIASIGNNAPNENGLAPDLALQVATELTNHDALGAHARDEIGIHENTEFVQFTLRMLFEFLFFKF
jgi:hypothetical protein